MTIAATGTNNGWDIAAELAIPAAEFLRNIYKKASDYVASSTAVKKELCPPQFQAGNLTGAYTLGSLITKTRPSLWIQMVVPVASKKDQMTGHTAGSTSKEPDKAALEHIISTVVLDTSDGFSPNETKLMATYDPKPKIGPFAIKFPSAVDFVNMTVPFIPLVIASISHGFHLGKYGSTLARMGGNTVNDFIALKKLYVTDTKNFDIFLKLVDFLGRKSKNDNNFPQLRGFVHGLINSPPKEEKNTANQLSKYIIPTVSTVSKLLETNSSQKDKQDASNILIDYYNKYKKLIEESKKLADENLSRGSSFFLDESYGNQYWVQMYSKEAILLLDTPKAMLIKKAFEDVLNIMNAYTLKITTEYPNKLLFHKNFFIATNKKSADVMLQYEDPETEKALKTLISALNYLTDADFGEKIPNHFFGAAALPYEPRTEITGKPADAETSTPKVAYVYRPSAYARSPLTFQLSILEHVFADALALSGGNLDKFYLLYVPSHPNTEDKQPLNLLAPNSGGWLAKLKKDSDYEPIESNDYNSNVNIWDVPGIRSPSTMMMMMRTNVTKYRDVYNETLNTRFKSLRKESNSLTRLISSIYCLTSIKLWKDVQNLAIKNVPLPIHPIPVYIRGGQRTETAIMGIRGPKTGQIWYSSGNYTTGVNVTGKWITGSYTVWATAIVTDPNRIELLYNIAPAGIEGGFGTEFYPFPSNHARPEEAYKSEILTQPGQKRPSLIVLSASPTEARELLTIGDFDLIGRSTTERFRNVDRTLEEMGGRVAGEYQLSTRLFYDELWNFREIIGHSRGSFGTYSSRTMSSYWDEDSNKLGNFKQSTSVRKTGYGIGSAKVWNGIDEGFTLFNRSNNTINA